MTLLTYFFPLIGAILGLLISFLIIFSFFNKNKLQKVLLLELKNVDLESDFQEILDHYLNGFVGTLKQQIPMANMYLTGSVSEKLKNLAKQDFIKMTPEIKERILAKLVDNSAIFERSIKTQAKKVCAVSSVIGFLLGLALSLLYNL